MAEIKKKSPIWEYLFWYHSQDWINEGPTIPGIDKENRTWPRPERFKAVNIPPIKRVVKARGRKSKPMPTEKKCIKCGVVQPLASFERSKVCKDGHINTCKTCKAKSARARYAKKCSLEARPCGFKIIPSPM